MNVVLLKYAIEVAKTGSINKAAENLYVAQPNLSRAIKELESELGVSLFQRTSKGMILTHEGAILIKRAQKIIKDLDEVEYLFKNDNNLKKSFSISVPRATYIGTAFSAFASAFSDIESFDIYYKETNALRTINGILAGDYHLGIIRYAVIYDSYFKSMLEDKKIHSESIAEFEYNILVNKDSPLAQKDLLYVSDLANYIEIAHADPYVPLLPLSIIKKDELPEVVNKRIYVFERASQLDLLSKNKEAYMWVSPVPKETLERYNLTLKKCVDKNRLYKDVLIYQNGYKLTELDKMFITYLCEEKRKIIK